MAKRTQAVTQFSLMQLLIAAVAIGALAGFAGPPIVRLLRSPVPAISPASSRPPAWNREPETPGAYYESSETPLD